MKQLHLVHPISKDRKSRLRKGAIAMSQKNRGRYFEEWINLSNQIYMNRDLAIIQKIPTPWIVNRKRNPYKNTYEISGAFPQKSTVDFGGTAAKFSIWFDVKVTKLKNNFPLKNIHKHQIDYLKQVHRQGGKAFLLIHSEERGQTWLLWIADLLHFMTITDRKSIPFDWLHENCKEIVSNNGIPIDYLPHVITSEG